MEIDIEGQVKHHDLINILKINEKLSRIKDIDSLLERVLFEARRITHADAGSIYLRDGDQLTFEFVQNDGLRKNGTPAAQFKYLNQTIPINNQSISGYAANTRQSVMIADAYHLQGKYPYTFNSSYDELSHYHTKSMLTVPFITQEDQVAGVIQIINAKDERGEVVPFTGEDKLLVDLFANQAAIAIERAKMTRNIILGMIKIAELRDPTETGPHVKRVSAYAVEIYQRWAIHQGMTMDQTKKICDILRIAAMLHDVGKVAVSDVILRKNTQLSPGEFLSMKMHTIYGARLFQNSQSEWDDMAAEIALNHHEKWDGSGYPGHVHIEKETQVLGAGKKGGEIPLLARIVAVADVYDALASLRVYKEPWSEERVLEYIEKNKGKHFDPDIVNAFLEIHDIIMAIRKKFLN